MAWCALAEAIPLYPVYALLFAGAGLSEASISALFMVWSLVAVVAEVPSGALADRFSRRGALVAAGVLQATAYALWLAAPSFWGFAAGFALWGVAGSLASGAFQALLYEGLASTGEERRYAVVLARAEAAALAVQVPVAGAASALAAVGGLTLAGVASIGACLAAASLATTLPDVRAGLPGRADGGAYLTTLAAGVREALGSPPVRGAVAGVAALTTADAVEEYFPLLASQWGVPQGAIPPALLAVPLAGAVGAALGGRAGGLGPVGLAATAAAAAAALAAAGLLARPLGIVGLVAFYGLWRLVLVVADARLQSRIEGPSRATVTSVAGLLSELSGIALFATWAAGGPALVCAFVLAVALAGPALLGGRVAGGLARADG